MQFKMLIPPVPSRVQFQTVLGHSGNSGQFRLKYKFRPVLESELRERENEKNSLENETMGYLPLLQMCCCIRKLKGRKKNGANCKLEVAVRKLLWKWEVNGRRRKRKRGREK